MSPEKIAPDTDYTIPLYAVGHPQLLSQKLRRFENGLGETVLMKAVQSLASRGRIRAAEFPWHRRQACPGGNADSIAMAFRPSRARRASASSARASRRPFRKAAVGRRVRTGPWGRDGSDREWGPRVGSGHGVPMPGFRLISSSSTAHLQLIYLSLLCGNI